MEIEKRRHTPPRLIGMVHLLPLPGTSGFDGDTAKIEKRAVADALALERAGFDAVMIENMGDMPFHTELETAQKIALASLATLVSRKTSLPLGINAAFNDYETALAVAKCVGADFVRIQVFVDTAVYHGGIVLPCAREALDYRKSIGAEDVSIYADIQVKHTHLLASGIPLEESAIEAEKAGADAVVVTGFATGKPVSTELLEKLKNLLRHPLLVGSGVNEKNITEQLALADGVIVGSSLKEGGLLKNPVSLELAARFVKAARKKGEDRA